MSPYNYCENNPVMLVDPSGEGADLPETATNKYGEKQVYTQKNYVDNGFGGVGVDEKTITPSGTAVSNGLNDVQLYRLAVGRVLSPGQFKINSNQYLDEKYFSFEEKAKYYFSHLASVTMANSPSSKELTAQIHDTVVQSLFSSDNVKANAAVEQIETRNSIWNTFNWGKTIVELATAGSLVNRFNKLWIASLGSKAENLLIPKGFTSIARFKEAGEELAGALQQSGIKYSEIGVRGSAVTNVSSKGGGFREAAANGLKPSDVDVYIHLSEDIGLKSSKSIEGFIHPDKLLKQYPLLQKWSDKWSRVLGREITPGAFKPGTFTDKSIIKMKF